MPERRAAWRQSLLVCRSAQLGASVVALAMVMASASSWAQSGDVPARSEPNAATPVLSTGIDDSMLDAAAARLAQDPLLPGRFQTETWRLRSDPEKPEARKADPAVGTWVAQVAEVLRWGAWLVVAIAVVLIGLRLARWARLRAESRAWGRPDAPAQVGGFDIRPDTLPDDVPGVARALWRGGDARAALTLMYRAALSRLVHRHGVAIDRATTEGECLTLAAPHLDGPRWAYLQRLVAVWTALAYAGREPSSDDGLALCDGFTGFDTPDALAVADTAASAARP